MTPRRNEEDEETLAAPARQEPTATSIQDAAAHNDHEQAVSELSTRARARYAELLDHLGR